ncbi:hypothetical protein KK083_02960 [Fulvivirgaceae bacterium PWU4]|uniref:Uncharacterized protein n=1 Tax=Chryseosolibacter histidini TaxID=2782349 RepID=A0AAP2DIH8_9BACT|nr:DUF6169 family protein [Chryseosolibacter histidini]MBT1695822.1 hypothetical protein [Chryseosolibacter histidini]
MLTPYQLVTSAKGYKFLTSHQIGYEVYFTDITPTFPGVTVKVFSFGFDCLTIPAHIDPSNLPGDTRIGETIAAVLDDFFTSNTDIIVYVPMDTDRKAGLRLRLFDLWWHKYKPLISCQQLERDRYTFTYPDDQFVATMIYRSEVRSEAQAVIYGLESFNEGK